MVPRGHCTWIVKHQTTWAEDPGSLVLMSKTQEVCSLQNGFNNKNRMWGRMCDVIFNHRERGARAAETVPCQGTPREGHIALRLVWGWTGDLLGWLEENRGGRGGHLFSLGGAPRQAFTVQFTHRPRWGDSGHQREQDGEGYGDIYRSLLRVSCSPGWPSTGYSQGWPCTPALSASVSQVRDGSCVPPNLVSVVLEWNSGFMQLGEFCPLSGRASSVIFFFPFGLVLL